MIDDDKIWLTPTDIKNWNFCQRIPYYHYYGEKKFYKTASMKYGEILHEIQITLEKRNKGKKYRLQNLRKETSVSLLDNINSFSGKLDMLLYDEKKLAYPVEFKNIQGKPSKNHIGQLFSYAFLLKMNRCTIGDCGFIYNIEKKHLYEIELKPAEIDSTKEIIDKIRDYIFNERLPAPTKHKNKCRNCEFLRFCNDIF